MKYIKNIAISLATLVWFVSCDEGGDPDPGGTSTEQLAGDWYVETYLADGTKAQDYALWSTYNTAANDGTLWVDDQNHTFGLKAKAQTSGLAFSASNAENINNEGTTVTITDGEVLKGVATTSGGNVSDSIYLKVEVSNSPGTVYEVRGYKRTGFAEDEH
ncbi:hypothetical protein UJ101_01520 [Flavobacteriaceae bacterium UJ101]|nr:hypothetical protein UJ101_01520 [Flavobacteriaceae bacterium UJ101]